MSKRGKRQKMGARLGLFLGVLLGTVAVTAGALLFLTSGPDRGLSTPPPAVTTAQAPAPAATPAPPPTPSPAAKPTPAPTLAPTPVPEQGHSPRARVLLAELSLREKVCQLFVVYPEAVTGVGQVVAAGSTTQKALEKYPVGGFIYNRGNLQSQEQVKTMLAKVQSYAKIPLILTCDEEGGRVNRVMGTVGTTWVGPMLNYKDQGVETARKNAETIGADLKALGFNMDLAPVADVWSNPQNTVIGDRAYSDNFEEAAKLIPAAVEGFHSGGVACCVKHFPGHGDTSADSHYGSVYVNKTLAEIEKAELLPFQAGIDAGVDAVMIGHLILADVDSEPAPFSYKIVTELLREQMGFDGVVITDGLQMQAMTDHYSSAEIAVKAVKAGVDILLCPNNLDAAVEALIKAVESGDISMERLDESVLRILELKLENGIIAEVVPNG